MARHLGVIELFDAAQDGPLKDQAGALLRDRQRIEQQLRFQEAALARFPSPFAERRREALRAELAGLEGGEGEGKRFEYLLRAIERDIVPEAGAAALITTVNFTTHGPDLQISYLLLL